MRCKLLLPPRIPLVLKARLRHHSTPQPLSASAPPPCPAHCHSQLSAVVLEREKGLRQALKTMGMLESGGSQ